MKDHLKIEPKWQAFWENNETFKTNVWDFAKPKVYIDRKSVVRERV